MIKYALALTTGIATGYYIASAVVFTHGLLLGRVKGRKWLIAQTTKAKRYLYVANTILAVVLLATGLGIITNYRRVKQ